jgi:transcriptional regulator with XRE-family HTH domain
VIDRIMRDRVNELGWNIETAAKRVGMNRNMLSMYMRGKYTNPNLKTMQRIAQGLKISVGQLIGEVAIDADKNGV